MTDVPGHLHFFVYPPNDDGTVPNPPGFWSLSSDPFARPCIQLDSAEISFDMWAPCIHSASASKTDLAASRRPFVHYENVPKPVYHIIRDLNSLGFLPVPEVKYCTFPTLSPPTIPEMFKKPTPDQGHTEEKRKKKIGDTLISAFTKRGKTARV